MKKFLSLVLALVMTMSLVTISAGAKDFTDADTITYDEAVAVMSAVKVIDGYTDDSFKPTATLTRGAAAKIICNLILGPTTAAELPASVAPFKDVPANSTFAGYIAYCAKEGIVGGYADGTFKPGASLTGYAFMKMLLGALGYDAETEGYNTPGTWSISVAKQAIGIGLDKGLTAAFDGTTYVTREEACLYAFNTLKATLVEYTEKTTVNVGGAEVVLQGAPKEVSWGTATNNDGNIGGKKDGHVQFAEKYFPKLVQKDAVDAFGRPSWTWVNDKKEIDTFVDYTTLVAEYSEKVTGKELYELITKSVLDDSDVLVYVDGVENTTANKANLDDAYFTKGNIVKTNTEGVGDTGNGVLTQVFVDTDADEIIISIINTYLAKANEDYDEKNDDLSLTVFNIDKVGTQYFKNDDEDETIKVKGDKFDIKDVAEKDLFLVQVADGEIQTMEAAETINEATITNFKLGKYVTAEGEKKDYADTARYDVEVLDQYDDKNMKELTYNVILDQYGYLIGLELNQDPDKYVFLTGMNGNASNLSAKNADANIIFTDGTMDTVSVNTKKSELPAAGSQMNTWCTYTVDSNGVYTLKQVPVSGIKTAIDTDAKPAIKVAQYAQDAGVAGITIDQKHVSLKGADTKSVVYGNDDTVYLNVELKNLNTADIGDTTRQIIDDVESVTTGVKNVKITVKDVADKGAYDAPDAEVYTLYKSNGYIIAAVTIGQNDGIASNYAYITSASGSKGVNKEAYDASADKWTWSREAVVDGKKVTLTEVGDTLDILDTMVQGEWYEVKYDADGNVRRAEKIAFATADTTANSHKFLSEVLDVEKSVETYDTALLFTDGATKLTYKNGTLYTNTEATEGFSVSPEVKVVLSLAKKDKDNKVSEFDKVTDDYTGYSGLETAIRNLDTNFKGDLSAILKNGAATVIVLNDVTGTKVDTGSETVKETDLYSYTTFINAMGTGSIRMTVNRPAWAVGTVDVSYDILVNGKYYDTINSGAEDLAAGQDKETNNFVIDYFAFDTKDVITVDNFKMTPAQIAVKVVDENGKTVKQEGTPTEAITTTAGDLWIKPDSAVYDTTAATYTVAGTTATTAPTGSVTPGTAKNIGPVAAKGDGFVTVTITGLKAKEVTYSVTNLSDTALSTWSTVVTDATDGLVTVAVTAGKTSSIKAGTPVEFTLAASANTTNFAYEVSVAKLGMKLVVAPTGTYTTSKTITVDKDIAIAASDVVVTKLPVAKVTGVSWTANTVTINLDCAAKTLTSGAVVEHAGGFADTDAAVDTVALSSNGKVITVTVKNGTLAAGDKLTIDASKIVDAYGVDLDDQSKPTITLAADGVASIGA